MENQRPELIASRSSMVRIGSSMVCLVRDWDASHCRVGHGRGSAALSHGRPGARASAPVGRQDHQKAACILCIGAFAAKCTCIKSGCTREAAKGSAYCWVHKPSKSNSSVSGSSSSIKHKYTCIKDGCTREADKDSAYCWVHRPSKSSTKSNTSYSSKSSYSSSYSSSKKSYKTYDSYDDGYDAIYDDDDYDEDRYDSDPDYAAGVDDAMDELDW